MSRRTGAKDDTPRRVRWMISRISECFELPENQIARAFKTEDSRNKLANFALPNGPRRILAYYQTRLDPSIALENNDDSTTTPETEDSTYVPGDEAEVFLTYGTTEPLLGKACYFLRMDPTGDVLSMDTGADENVIFGEFGVALAVDDSGTNESTTTAAATTTAQPVLSDLQTLIDVLFSKGLRQLKYDAWGPNSKEDVNEILDQVDHFGAELGATIQSRSRVIDLPLPEEEFVDTPRTHDQKELVKNDGKRITTSSYKNKTGSYESKRLHHYATLLESWCVLIETDINEIRESETIHGENAANGPASEIEYWRRRMQRLTVLAEQLKTSKCLNVVQVVVKYSKESDMDQKRSLSMLPSDLLVIIRRWKSLDVTITEYINEAMDISKYLKTLDKFMDPLSNPDPKVIVEILPSLMNSIKLIYTIARYYNTEERMTNFFKKITYQMIYISCGHILSCCNKKEEVQDGKKDSTNSSNLMSSMNTKEEKTVTKPVSETFSFRNGVVNASSAVLLWDASAKDLVLAFQTCLQLNEAYHDQYTATQEKLLQMDHDKQVRFIGWLIGWLVATFCCCGNKCNHFVTFHSFFLYFRCVCVETTVVTLQRIDVTVVAYSMLL